MTRAEKGRAPVQPTGAWAIVTLQGDILASSVRRTRGEAIDWYMAGETEKWAGARRGLGVRCVPVVVSPAYARDGAR